MMTTHAIIWSVFVLLHATQTDSQSATWTLPYPAQCETGFSTQFIERCSSVCQCSSGTCEKCCKLNGNTCEYADPVGWTVAGQCNSCASGFTLNPLAAAGCNHFCSLFMTSTSGSYCCRISGGYCQRSSSLACPATPLVVSSAPALAALPAKYVMASPGVILNQGNCGDCYVQSASGLMAEHVLAIQNSNVIISPQLYTSCGAGTPPTTAAGCNGGAPLTVLQYYQKTAATTCTTACTTGCQPFFSGYTSSGAGVVSPTTGGSSSSQCPAGYSTTLSNVPYYCVSAAKCGSGANCQGTSPRSVCTGTCDNCVKVSAAGCSYTTPQPPPVYSYDACGGQCQNGTAVSESFMLPQDYTPTSFTNSLFVLAPNGAPETKYLIPESVMAQRMQRAILEFGSVANGFQVYKNFVTFFQSDPAAIYDTTGNSPLAGGHSVRIVGWGSTNGVDYWYAANSWGTTYGENGFFRYLRGTNLAGFESLATYILPPSATAAAAKFVAAENKTQDGTENDTETGPMAILNSNTHSVTPGGWIDANDADAADVAGFLLDQDDAFEGATMDPNGTLHNVSEINEAKQQIVSAAVQYWVQFTSQSNAGEKFHHTAAVVQHGNGSLQRTAKENTGTFISGPPSVVEEGETIYITGHSGSIRVSPGLICVFGLALATFVATAYFE